MRPLIENPIDFRSAADRLRESLHIERVVGSFVAFAFVGAVTGPPLQRVIGEDHATLLGC